MGVKAGLDPAVMLDVINAGSGRNTATQDKFPKAVLTGTFDIGFAARLAYQDVRLCVDESEANGVPMAAGSAVREMLLLTTALCGDDADFTHVAKVLETWGGVPIRARGGSRVRPASAPAVSAPCFRKTRRDRGSSVLARRDPASGAAGWCPARALRGSKAAVSRWRSPATG